MSSSSAKKYDPKYRTFGTARRARALLPPQVGATRCPSTSIPDTLIGVTLTRRRLRSGLKSVRGPGGLSSITTVITFTCLPPFGEPPCFQPTTRARPLRPSADHAALLVVAKRVRIIDRDVGDAPYLRPQSAFASRASRTSRREEHRDVVLAEGAARSRRGSGRTNGPRLRSRPRSTRCLCQLLREPLIVRERQLLLLRRGVGPENRRSCTVLQRFVS